MTGEEEDLREGQRGCGEGEEAKGFLEVRVVEGKALEAGPQLFLGGFANSSNPYVVLKLLGVGQHPRVQEKRTQWVRKNLDPAWNEKFTFEVEDQGCYGPPVLLAEVWDRNWIWDDPLGEIAIQLLELPVGPCSHWLNLTGCATGQIHLETNFKAPLHWRWFPFTDLSLSMDHQLHFMHMEKDQRIIAVGGAHSKEKLVVYSFGTGQMMESPPSIQFQFVLCTDTLLVAATGDHVQLWDTMDNGKNRGVVPCKLSFPHQFQFLKEMKWCKGGMLMLYGVAQQDSKQILRLRGWNLDALAEPYSPMLEKSFSSCGISSIISCVDYSDSILVQGVSAQINATHYAPYLQLYDVDTQRCLAHLTPSDLPVTKSQVSEVLLAEAGKRLFTVQSGRVYMWDIQEDGSPTNSCLWFCAREDQETPLHLSEHGGVIVATYSDAQKQIHCVFMNMKSGQQNCFSIRSENRESLLKVAHLSGIYLLAHYEDGTIYCVHRSRMEIT